MSVRKDDSLLHAPYLVKRNDNYFVLSNIYKYDLLNTD